VALARGRSARATPGTLCSWCPVLARCGEGKAAVARTDGTVLTGVSR
jgi:hypothetical protein